MDLNFSEVEEVPAPIVKGLKTPRAPKAVAPLIKVQPRSIRVRRFLLLLLFPFSNRYSYRLLLLPPPPQLSSSIFLPSVVSRALRVLRPRLLFLFPCLLSP